MKRRSKQGEEKRIRVTQQGQQKDEGLHGRVDVPRGWQPRRVPEEMR